jgi:Protein of unknown function (DUF2283)
VIEVSFDEDAEANAASITFDPTARGRQLRTYPVEDESGSILATVTFDASGRLVQVELLDAVNQVPANLR